MISTVTTAFISFISTNIDDIFILMLFFSQINKTMKLRHIIIGQYLGIVVLIILSLVGALGISVIPHEYVGLLGLLPIYLGIKEYVSYKMKKNENISLQEQESFDNFNLDETTETKGNSIITFIKIFINPSIIKVFTVTFANGGDNIGIYIPLFTSISLVDILITAIIFLILTAIWCFIGLKLAEHPFVQKKIKKYNHIIIPILFISLGIFILIESGTINFIYKKAFLILLKWDELLQQLRQRLHIFKTFMKSTYMKMKTITMNYL